MSLLQLETKAEPIKKISGRGKGIAAFRRNTRAAVRGLWTGALNKNQAFDAFVVAIEQAIDLAWIEGAAECGIQPDEFTEEEIEARDDFIFMQTGELRPFIDDIESKSKANKGELTPLLVRNEMWVNRYNDAKNQSKTVACADTKGQWFLGRTEEHCISCAGFNRRVYRFSVWAANNALPQNICLSCNGFRCECEIRPTDKPITPGRFPSRLVKC